MSARLDLESISLSEVRRSCRDGLVDQLKDLQIPHSPSGYVYLLHFSPAYRHAGHYVGWTEILLNRLTQHANGWGARLVQVAVAAGSRPILAAVWAGDRSVERRTKGRGMTAHCPVCALAAGRNPSRKPGELLWTFNGGLVKSVVAEPAVGAVAESCSANQPHPDDPWGSEE